MIEETYNKLSYPEQRIIYHCYGKGLNGIYGNTLISFFQVMPENVTGYGGKQYHTNKEAFFAALCIRSMFGDKDKKVSPEKFLKMARHKATSEQAFDHRIAKLMPYSPESKTFAVGLMQLMKYAKTLVPGFYPDCEQIYWDIVTIGDPERSVQYRWADEIYVKGEIKYGKN